MPGTSSSTIWLIHMYIYTCIYQYICIYMYAYMWRYHVGCFNKCQPQQIGHGWRSRSLQPLVAFAVTVYNIYRSWTSVAVLATFLGASQWRPSTSSLWLCTLCALTYDWIPGCGGVSREVSMGGSPAPCAQVRLSDCSDSIYIFIYIYYI